MDDGCTKFRVYNSQSCGGSIIKNCKKQGIHQISLEKVCDRISLEANETSSSSSSSSFLSNFFFQKQQYKGKKDQEIYPQNGYAVLDETTMILATQISKELEELQKDVAHQEAAAGLQSRCSPLKDALEMDSVFADQMVTCAKHEQERASMLKSPSKA